MGIFIYFLVGISMVFANESEVHQIKPQSPGKMKRNTGMNQWVYSSRFLKETSFQTFSNFWTNSSTSKCTGSTQSKTWWWLRCSYGFDLSRCEFFWTDKQNKKNYRLIRKKLGTVQTNWFDKANVFNGRLWKFLEWKRSFHGIWGSNKTKCVRFQTKLSNKTTWHRRLLLSLISFNFSFWSSSNYFNGSILFCIKMF